MSSRNIPLELMIKSRNVHCETAKQRIVSLEISCLAQEPTV